MNNKHLDLQTEIEANEINNQSRGKVLIRLVVGVIITVILGFWSSKVYNRAILETEGDAFYQNYVDECQVFLERTEAAGDAITTQEQLIKATMWLDNNYPANSFEYKEIKKDLNYLQQHRSSLVPENIGHSISYSHKLIDKFENEKHEDSSMRFPFMMEIPFASISFLVFLSAIVEDVTDD